VHVLASDGLPPIDKDSIDRLLLAQASTEGITLRTADAVVASYPGSARKVQVTGP
jgi:PIN domain nuclease of toxin-antitoxin system